MISIQQEDYKSYHIIRVWKYQIDQDNLNLEPLIIKPKKTHATNPKHGRDKILNS